MNKRALIAEADIDHHFRYEVQLLCEAASHFGSAKHFEKIAMQDCALMHGRNLLEFTNPEKRPTSGWWIHDLGTEVPGDCPDYRSWVNFINANVSHMASERRLSLSPPGGKDEDVYLKRLANFCLDRITSLPIERSNAALKLTRAIAQHGINYLRTPDTSRHAKLVKHL